MSHWRRRSERRLTFSQTPRDKETPERALAVPPLHPQPFAAKVPEITVMFWVIKILTTAAGEAISDYLSTGNKAVGALVEVAVFVAALIAQFGTRRYFAPAYWFLALAIAIAGTGVADTMHLIFGIPYAVTSLFWAVVLASSSSSGTAASTRCHPHHHDQPPGEVLLVRHLRHVRPGHRGRGLRRDDPGAGLPGFGRLLLRRHPHPVDRVVPLPHERDLRLLVRLRRHPADRCVLRRLLQQAKGPQRPRLR